ncbi:MAG: hypothetical protein J6V25_00500 [Oscillospiraceae bacterium]|nr:hypothetical protein [Oscillospiraceae bacterium]
MQMHTVGLRADGTLLVVGNNNQYDLSSANRWKNIVSIAAFDTYLVGLKADGTAVGVGFDTYGQGKSIPKWKNLVAIYTSAWHTVGLCSDGTLVAGGFNEHGQCDVSEWTDIKFPSDVHKIP